MLDEKCVWQPWEIRRVLGAGDRETFVRKRACRCDEQLLNAILTIRRVCPEIGKRSAICVLTRDGLVHLGINAAVEGRNLARAKFVPQRIQSAAPGEAE